MSRSLHPQSITKACVATVDNGVWSVCGPHRQLRRGRDLHHQQLATQSKPPQHWTFAQPPGESKKPYTTP